MSDDNNVCGECGSGSLVASGVFEHGTWIHRLTCWTCLDCRSVLAIPESEATVSNAAGDLAPAGPPRSE
jgi:hypothetical protein